MRPSPSSPVISSPRRRARLRAALLGLGLAGGLGPGCSRDDLYGEATFTDNVAKAYAECNDGEIKFLTSKHNLRLAFRPCGSNKFAATAWSPDGTLLYFQLTHGGHILIGDEKRIETIDIETPIGRPAWLRDHVLVLPLPPEGISEVGELGEAVARKTREAGKPARFAIYDRGARTVYTVDVPEVQLVQDLAATGKGDEVIFTAVGADGARGAYTFDPATRTLAPALPAVVGPIDRLSWDLRSGLAAVTQGDVTRLFRAADGSEVKVFPGVRRAIPHPDGRYIALEVDGAPISMFDQTTWREVDPEQRAREQARRDQWLEGLPEWAPRELTPPELHIYDLQLDQRWRITAFYGDHFEWLQPQPYWASFIVWGIEGKQVHRNVVFTDLREKLRMAAMGNAPYGVEAWAAAGPGPSGSAPAPGGEAPVSAETPPPTHVSGQTPPAPPSGQESP